MLRVLGTDKGREVLDKGVDVQGAGDTVRKTGRCQTGGWMFRVLGTQSERQGGVRLGGGCLGCWGHTQKHREVSD